SDSRQGDAMKIRNLVSALVLALGTAGAATLSQAAVLEFDVGVAPPAAPVEVVPAPRAGYIYEPGHYASGGNKYVWTEGHFFRNREGHTWTPFVFERRGDLYHF